LQGPFQTDPSRQALGAAPAGDQTEFDLRQTHLQRAAGALDVEPVVTGQGQLQPAAQADALDVRDGVQRQ
jgi:hypothetical protein